jgi:hypothetical protein
VCTTCSVFRKHWGPVSPKFCEDDNEDAEGKADPEMGKSCYLCIAVLLTYSAAAAASKADNVTEERPKITEGGVDGSVEIEEPATNE